MRTRKGSPVKVRVDATGIGKILTSRVSRRETL